MAKGQSNQGDDFFICPSCGAEVAMGAKFCRECGASDDSGWNEDDSTWDEESPDGYGQDTEFDYDEYLSREFPEEYASKSKLSSKHLATAILIILICLALLVCSIAPF